MTEQYPRIGRSKAYEPCIRERSGQQALPGGTMTRRWWTGVTAAAVLPSALGAALLVSAPFAGTTTAPLADSHTQAAVQHEPAKAAPSALAPMHFDVPARAIVTLVAAELALVSVGAGVIVVARRNRLDDAEDAQAVGV